MTHAERRNHGSYRDGSIHVAGEAEHHQSLQGSVERGRTTRVATQPQRRRRVADVQTMSVGMRHRHHGQSSQQPCRRGSENSEPEDLDVGSERVMTDALHQGVGPADDDDLVRDVARMFDAGVGADSDGGVRCR